MNTEFFIARHIYTHKEADGRKKMPAAVRVAVAGIALGLAVMILSVAIISGFKKEVRAKVIGFGAHVQISNFDNNASYEPSPIIANDSLLQVIRGVEGVRHVEAFVTKPGILKTDSDYQGIVLKGVGEDFDWSFFRSNLKAGHLPRFRSDSISTQALISRYLSNLLGLKTGDAFLAYFVSGKEHVRARRFTVSGIYETGFIDYDRLFVLCDIQQVRRLNGWSRQEVGGLEIQADGYEQMDKLSDRLYQAVGDRPDAKGNLLYVRSARDLNPMIFSWLDVLDTNVAVILVLMLAVAGFTMISGLLIIILERIQMIGILKAMGETNARIRKIFLYVAFFLIGKGMLWGNLIGVVLCLIQHELHIVKMDAATYYLNAVPIDLHISALLLLNIGALAGSLLMMIAPSHIVTTIHPAKTIRFE
ncbi:MAG: ABC transporter permease [Tannerella sp.]|jgi:lipoprotein-releasing system permease protein|nr:ABC transporter permease [Tannerella sp.]